MKKNLLYFVFFIIIGCYNEPRRSSQIVGQAASKKNITSIDDTVKVLISVSGTDSIVYTKGDLKKILQYHPELTADNFPLPPDVSYELCIHHNNINHQSVDLWLHFGSEQG